MKNQCTTEQQLKQRIHITATNHINRCILDKLFHAVFYSTKCGCIYERMLHISKQTLSNQFVCIHFQHQADEFHNPAKNNFNSKYLKIVLK